jgi:hypothetical protein
MPTRAISSTTSDKPFMKRHARLFTYIGGIIVFTTFVVKDNLQERWKETANAIDIAQYFYTLRTDLRNAQASLESIEDNLGQFADQYAADKNRRPDVGKVDKDIEAIYDLLILLSTGVDDRQKELAPIQILVERMADEGDKDQLIILSRNWKNLKARIDGALPWPPDDGPEPNETVADYQKRSDAADLPELESLRISHNSLHNEYSSLHREQDSFIAHVLQQAHDLQAANSRKAGYASWLSAGLYTLGWGLGLAGKLYGAGDDLVGVE